MSAALHPVRTDVALLAAVHAWAAGRAPHVHRVLPDWGREGDPVVILGRGFGRDEVRVCFGGRASWGIALSDRAVLSVVPAGAAGPVTVLRHGLRSNPAAFGGGPGDGAAWVVRVDPRDGATGVFRDAPVVLSVSHPLDPRTLTDTALTVDDVTGRVPGRARLSPDARVVIWQADRLLWPRLDHTVRASGLRDVSGRQVAAHQSMFVPCGLAWADLTG